MKTKNYKNLLPRLVSGELKSEEDIFDKAVKEWSEHGTSSGDERDLDVYLGMSGGEYEFMVMINDIETLVKLKKIQQKNPQQYKDFIKLEFFKLFVNNQ